VIGWLFLLAVVGLHGFFLWSVRGRIARGNPDFTVYYTAGKMLREGRRAQLYDPRAQQAVQQEFATDSNLRRGPLPYIHPPFEALLFLPLTYLSYPAAFGLWNLINLGVLFGVSLVLRRSLVSLRRFRLWELVLACLAFFPVLANFHQGQDAILLLLLFVLGFSALSRNADFAAGCWLGLGVFKFQFVIPLALILALWRGRKLALGFAVVASVAALASLALIGWHEALRYPVYVWHIVSSPSLGGLPARLMPNLVGLASGWPSLENASGPLQWVAVVASAGLLIAVARMGKLASHPEMFKLNLACAVITAVLVGYNTNTYDLSVLILPLAVLADHCLSARSGGRTVRAAAVIPVLPLLLSPLWFFIWLGWGRTNLMAIFLLWWLYAMRQEIMGMSAAAEGSA
jgi:hypothetical protein